MRTLVLRALAVLAAALPARAQTVLFSEGFESGLSNWNATGFWHVESISDTCVSQVQPLPEGTHCAYYGIAGNGRRIRWYHHQLVRIWKKWLARCGRHSNLPWPRFRAMLARYPLPPALIVHQYAVA